MKIILKSLILIFALLYASISFAQKPNNNYIQIRKELLEHQNNLLKSVESSTVDQVWAYHSIGSISRQIAEYDHLANLEELKEIIEDEKAKGLIVKKIGNLRFFMNDGCRSDLISINSYGKYSKNPKLVIALNGLAKELTRACSNL